MGLFKKIGRFFSSRNISKIGRSIGRTGKKIGRALHKGLDVVGDVANIVGKIPVVGDVGRAIATKTGLGDAFKIAHSASKVVDNGLQMKPQNALREIASRIKSNST